MDSFESRSVFDPDLFFLFFFPSVEVNNFLKIDENQNEDTENNLPESPVRRYCTDMTDFLSKIMQYISKFPALSFRCA